MTGRHKKIYCFAMVMTHSRQKFALWQENPFTTDCFIQAHMRAFAYYGGRPIEIVYDQDKILAVSENHGDIIYTEGFQNYVNAVKFDIFLCHGADPESKGKVENVVKYVKHGFAEHRIFRDIDSFNADCMAWLERTANGKVHGTTKKIPADVFELEREHLIPVSEYSFTPAVNDTITYQVRKDNIVLYKGNRYRVPKGTYEPGKKVYMMVENEIISITDCVTGEIYAKHRVIRRLFEEWNAEMLIEGLHYCTEREKYSATDLKSTVIYFNELKTDKHIKKLHTVLPTKYCGNKPQIRDLRLYEEAMERSAVNG